MCKDGSSSLLYFSDCQNISQTSELNTLSFLDIKFRCRFVPKINLCISIKLSNYFATSTHEQKEMVSSVRLVYSGSLHSAEHKSFMTNAQSFNT